MLLTRRFYSDKRTMRRTGPTELPLKWPGRFTTWRREGREGGNSAAGAEGEGKGEFPEHLAQVGSWSGAPSARGNQPCEGRIHCQIKSIDLYIFLESVERRVQRVEGGCRG